jgi:hypothetical protein
MSAREQIFSQVNDQALNVVSRNYGQLLRELIETLMYIVRVTCGGVQCVILIVNHYARHG